MARRLGSRSNSAPKYRLHKASGNALVVIDGKRVYLGKHGTDESHQLYKRLLAEQLSGGTLPEVVEDPEPDEPSEITISELAVHYGKHAKSYYRKNGKQTSEWHAVQQVLKRLRSIYGDLSAREFGPIRFERFRQVEFVDAGLSRTTINHYMLHVILMFNHGVRLELVPPEYHLRLKAVGTLKRNRTKAQEPKKIKPVDELIVRATQRELTPVVSDMVELQLLAGMRPGEVIQMRPCDIDRSNDIWTYCPATHKNEHHDDNERIIVIGPRAQKVLLPYLLRDHQAFCFTPSEAYQQHQEKRNQQRKTPKSCGNRAKGKRPANLRPCYDGSSYRVAIQRAASLAFPYPDSIKKNAAKKKDWDAIYKWSPNRLRHSAATLARKEHDLETAQQVCGHTNKRTTEKNYAEIDLSRAVEFAKKFG